MNKFTEQQMAASASHSLTPVMWQCVSIKILDVHPCKLLHWFTSLSSMASYVRLRTSHSLFNVICVHCIMIIESKIFVPNWLIYILSYRKITNRLEVSTPLVHPQLTHTHTHTHTHTQTNKNTLTISLTILFRPTPPAVSSSLQPANELCSKIVLFLR